ncbi:MAG TPA: response regulator, partial [Myxococcaceae bacterium]|nr:response regulator [Myxococcaceae bacterium]
MEDRAGRILVVDDDRVVLRWFEAALGSAKVALETVREATQAVPRAIAFQPDLILVDRHMPVLNGGEIVRALRAFPQTAGIHVAFITADLTEATLIRCVRSGARDVLLKPFDDVHVERVLALLADVRHSGPSGPPTPESQARTLLDVFRRDARDGTLRVNPGTPFEGRALFVGGALRGAEFGPLSGVPALEEMIGIEEAVWRFDRSAAPEPEHTRRLWIAAPEPSSNSSTRLLLVDDDPDLRRLFKAQLARAEFEVDLAEDGREGVQLARAREYDL